MVINIGLVTAPQFYRARSSRFDQFLDAVHCRAIVAVHSLACVARLLWLGSICSCPTILGFGSD
jgi:hypothetical protein